MKAIINQAKINRIHASGVRIPGMQISDAVKGGGRTPRFHPSLVDYWSFGGKNNSDPDRDKITGLLGNVLTAYNFAWHPGSGYGGYIEDFRRYRLNADYATVEVNSNTFTITEIKSGNCFLETIFGGAGKYKIRVRGLNSPNGNKMLEYHYAHNQDTGFESVGMWTDGEYELPAGSIAMFRAQHNGKCNIVVEQIPYHPEAIVTDGINDYLKFDQKGYNIGTVIIRHKLVSTFNRWQYIFDLSYKRTYIAYTNKTNADNNILKTNFDTNIVSGEYVICRYNEPQMVNTPVFISANLALNELASMALYDLAIYSKALTDVEVENEIELMKRLKL